MARNPLYPDALQPMEMQGNDLIGYKPTLADGWDYNAKAYNDWVAQQQADLVARGLNDPQTGWPTQAGWLDAAHQIGNSLLMGTTAPGIRAFHGSAHDFNAFDINKVGTGDGGAANGHGLYFAGKEGTARAYRDALGPVSSVMGLSPRNDAERMVIDHIKDGANELGTAPDLHTARDWVNNAEDSSDPMGLPEAFDSLLERADPGHMYEVNLNVHPDHLLDWGKPIAEQSQHVKDALKNAGIPTGNGSGATLYTNLAAQFGNDEAAASFALQQAGIPGTRYLGGQSRAAGEDAHHYVMFDPSKIQILRKYGLAGLMAGGTAAAASDQ